MKIKGILFDKDGTLIDFFSLWLTAAERAIPEFLAEQELPQDEKTISYVMEAIGVCDGKVDPCGALAYKSYREIAADIRTVFARMGVLIEHSDSELGKRLERIFQRIVTEKNQEYIPLGNLKELFQELKEKKIYIGLATADTYESAKTCMKRLGVLEYLDYLGADNGIVRPKPAPDMLEQFAERFAITPKEVAIVGDTANDIQFAKQCEAVSIGVLSGVSGKKELRGADYVIDSVEYLLPLLEEEMKCQKLY